MVVSNLRRLIPVLVCLLYFGVSSANAQKDSTLYCSQGDKAELLSAGYSPCSIAAACGPTLEEIHSRPIDVKDRTEALEIAEKMRNYGCSKVAVSLRSTKERGQTKFIVFSSDCTLQNSLACDTPDTMAMKMRYNLREGSVNEGDRGPSKIDLCLTRAVYQKSLMPGVRGKAKKKTTI